MVRIIIFSIALFLGKSVFAQNELRLSDSSLVSLVTCAPGEELYEAFGHTAIRIYDPATGFDFVFNYGTFDFNQPNFYGNFLQGRSKYMLAVDRYADFVAMYQYYNRSVREQFLDLTLGQKNRLLDKLIWNAKKENREYLYDYFYDNCSTRPRDVILEALDGTAVFDTTFLGKNRLTIRELTDFCIFTQQPWGDLGIDLCLGAPMDHRATAMQYMFLPEKLEEAFDHAYVLRDGEQIPLVKRKRVTFQAAKVSDKKSWFEPKWVFVALLLISSVLLTFMRVTGRSTRIFDGTVFIVTSIMGWLFVYLWFFTNHLAADNNWNVLWALPINTFFGVALLKKERPKWTRYYALVLIFLYAGMLVGWNYFPQLLHHSLKFIVLLQLFIAVGVFRIYPKK
ncbi:DUF4105 domain-containing protein [Bacteroidota bacterium]